MIAKRMALLLCGALLLTALWLPQTALAAETGGLRYTISVTKFENRAGWHGQWDLGRAWGMVLTDLLNQSGRFIVLGEKDMRNEAMREQDLAGSGRTAQGAKAPVTGQLTPAQLLVKGAITHVQDTGRSGGGISIGGVTVGGGGSKAEINATMYIVDSTTGMVLASTSVVGKSTSSRTSIHYSGHGWSGGYGNFQKSNIGKAVEDAVAQGVQWMIAQLPKVPWRGEVVMVQNGSVYVNRGAREGVTAGTVFLVGTANIIRDPSTGEVLDESVDEVARLQVATVKEKLSICEVIGGDPGAISQGMMIQKQ
ncbi:CsgG/HfaB family protein [Anaeroselena agilis]|uniref:CsgG/HfaB family protein n=1 Tax=Anaeroselena agilis TaxID=3063788 RepID=A0ABU3P119_9FIRM|nr:CsgG/HfaB family protein [Selenomonadales bacterium 4137-cl]